MRYKDTQCKLLNITLDSVNLLAIVNLMPVNGMSTKPDPFPGLDTGVDVTVLGEVVSPGKGTNEKL